MISSRFGSVVLQPTTVCNADCTYCYLLHRHENNIMDESVASAVAESIRIQNAPHVVDVVWHGGEPLAVGIRNFRKLIRPFVELEQSGQVRHIIQTNGILIDDQWCQFLKEHKFSVGVSIDGPEELNSRRVDLGGKAFFNKIISGLNCLKSNQVDFAVIAVVSTANLGDPQRFYDFFVDLGAEMLCINVEEQEGANLASSIDDDKGVEEFWKELFSIWRANPRIPIREFEQVLSYARHVISKAGDNVAGYDPFPTVAWNGDVTLLSPELAGVPSKYYNDFVVGNVVFDTLTVIVKRALSGTLAVDYLKGIETCKQTCSFFDFCRGGQASNKFFEHGSINAGETQFCKHSKKAPFLAVFNAI